MANRIPVFLASNDNYAPFVATTIASICYNTKAFIEFYILDSGICNFRKKQIEILKEKFDNFSIEFIEIDLVSFKEFQTFNYVSLDTYSRFLIPQLKPEIKKAIYSDVDVVFMDDIVELYNEDLGDFVIGAVDAIEEKGYNFLAGLLLINCEKWRDEKVTDNLVELSKIPENTKQGDQSILNLYFQEEYRRLDTRYCLTNSMLSRQKIITEKYSGELKKAIKSTGIRHYESPFKPWISNQTPYKNLKCLYFNEFWFFAEMTNFYAGLVNEFNASIAEIKDSKYRKEIKLFDFIPLLQIKKKNKRITIKLFGFIPIIMIKEK